MTNPTDAELEALIAANLLVVEGGQCAFESWADIRPELVKFARAVLAKWGTPPAVVGEPVAWRQGSLTTVNQDPYPSLGDWFVQFWEGDDVAARVYGNDVDTLRRRCAAITTPQPTQPQAMTPPPIECNTEELKRAYAFGWWSALEKQRETAQAGAEPLTDEQIEKLRRDTFSTENPFCPCDSKTMRKAVWATERAHGIGTEKGGSHGLQT